MNTTLLIVLTLILSPILGCLVAGIDRKLTARLQHRVGPPILQPFYDVQKLMNKENFVVNKYQNVYILIYLVFIVASLIMLVLQMDFLMIVFVFTIANVALIVGAMSTGSPFAKIGAQREIMVMLAYEPVLIFYVVGMYMLTGSFNISSLTSGSKPLIMYMPLIFIAMLFVMAMKFKKSPFDFSTSHHGHQELVKGIFTEFSGPGYGLVEIAHWYEYVFLLGLTFIFWKQNFIMGLVLELIATIFIIVLDNISARISWQWALKFAWSFLMIICIINLVIIYMSNLSVL